MGNRCYLYTCDADPTIHDVAPRGVAEHGDIALVQLLMVANGARAIESLIFDGQLAILADSAGAIERALAFLVKLGSGVVVDREQFDSSIAQMREFFAETTLGRYLLLEVGELLEGEEAVHELIEALPDLAAQAERALRGEEEPWLAEQRTAWSESGMPWWASTLYYSFGSPSVVWSREQVEQMLIPYDQSMSARLGHPFRYHLAPALQSQHQLTGVVNVLGMLTRDVESVPDPRVWNCEITVDENTIDVTASFRDATLFIGFAGSGWPSAGPRRRIMDAVGIAPPPTRVESGRGTV